MMDPSPLGWFALPPCADQFPLTPTLSLPMTSHMAGAVWSLPDAGVPPVPGAPCIVSFTHDNGDNVMLMLVIAMVVMMVMKISRYVYEDDFGFVTSRSNPICLDGRNMIGMKMIGMEDDRKMICYTGSALSGNGSCCCC